GDFFVIAFILARPQFIACHRIETVDTFELRRLSYSVGYIDSAVGCRGPAVAGPDFGTPADGQFRLIEQLNNAVFGPDTISIRTSPLRPVCAKNRDRAITETTIAASTSVLFMIIFLLQLKPIIVC
ncbi:MAG: hypothetical protein ACYTGS_14015, partial [Planctomycetota bacterium]